MNYFIRVKEPYGGSLLVYPCNLLEIAFPAQIQILSQPKYSFEPVQEGFVEVRSVQLNSKPGRELPEQLNIKLA